MSSVKPCLLVARLFQGALDKVGGREHGLERTYSLRREGLGDRCPSGDYPTGNPHLEADFRLRGLHLVRYVRNPEAQGEGTSMPRIEMPVRDFRQRRHERASQSESTEHLEISDQGEISCHSATGFIQIDVDAGPLRPGERMKEQVRASGGFPLPPALELMARRLLKTGELPAKRLDARAYGVDEGFEGENGGGGQSCLSFMVDTLSRRHVTFGLTVT